MKDKHSGVVGQRNLQNQGDSKNAYIRGFLLVK